MNTWSSGSMNNTDLSVSCVLYVSELCVVRCGEGGHIRWWAWQGEGHTWFPRPGPRCRGTYPTEPPWRSPLPRARRKEGREACGCRCAGGSPPCTTPRSRSSPVAHGPGRPGKVKVNFAVGFEAHLGLRLLNVWMVSSQVSRPKGCSKGVHLGKGKILVSCRLITYPTTGDSLRGHPMVWLICANANLSISLASHRPLVDVRRAAHQIVVVHHHQLGVHIDRVAQGLPGQRCPCRGVWILKTVRHVLRRLPLAHAIERQVVCWVCSRAQAFDCRSDPRVHALNRSELPTKNLLTGGWDRISLRVHWDTHVAVERLSRFHLVDDLLCDLPAVQFFSVITLQETNLPWNCVWRESFLII